MSSSDPAWHQAREREFIAHAQALLVDPQFVLDTASGRRSVAGLSQPATVTDKAVDLRRRMTSVRPDRNLEARMPTGQRLDANVAVNKMMIFQKVIASFRVACFSPIDDLLEGNEPSPMSLGEARRALQEIPPPLPGVPATIVIVSTSGFDPEAHELADRTSERTIILAEPNAAGGWSIHGPQEMKGVLDLMDPEPVSLKQKRVRVVIEALQDELLTGSLSADKIAHLSQLPLKLVEDEVKSYAKQTAGLASKRLDGRVLLFREGSSVAGVGVGGEGMSLLDRFKTLFGRKGDHERKIAFLSERKAMLVQSRDAMQNEIDTLEKKEFDLRKQFAANDSTVTRKRITSQMLQLQKEIGRRQQLMTVSNQQINIVSTHLHNLELVQAGKAAQLPSSDEIAADAAAAEETLAELQANAELADASSTVVASGMSSEEEALYDELMQSVKPAVRNDPATPASQSSEQRKSSPTEEPKRAEPEAG